MRIYRYTKNLSPDRINLSTLKGEGELSNLELDEVVLTDLLELPSWLRLTSAWCNRVCFRIQWTNIKTMPIVLVRRLEINSILVFTYYFICKYIIGDKTTVSHGLYKN